MEVGAASAKSIEIETPQPPPRRGKEGHEVLAMEREICLSGQLLLQGRPIRGGQSQHGALVALIQALARQKKLADLDNSLVKVLPIIARKTPETRTLLETFGANSVERALEKHLAALRVQMRWGAALKTARSSFSLSLGEEVETSGQLEDISCWFSLSLEEEEGVRASGQLEEQEEDTREAQTTEAKDMLDSAEEKLQKATEARQQAEAKRDSLIQETPVVGGQLEEENQGLKTEQQEESASACKRPRTCA